MKILLVEVKKHDYVNLALAKINAIHKQKNDEVKFVYGTPYFSLKFKPDIVYITTLYTWELKEIFKTIDFYANTFPKAIIKVGGICATMKKKELEERYKTRKNVEIFYGLQQNLENTKPDFSVFKTDYALTFTSKGCPNKCAYCVVWRLEPEYKELKNWDWFMSEIWKYKKIVIMDNNFLASTDKHFNNVVQRLSIIGNRTIDFNQGLDCRLLTEEKAKALSQLNIHPVRFAYDDNTRFPAIINAIELCFKYNLNDISLYMLYNFTDKPEDIYDRLDHLTNISGCNKIYIFLMKYQPLDTFTKGNYIGRNWTDKTLKRFMKLRNSNFVNGILRFNDKEHFNRIFGSNKKEFLKKISDEKIITQTQEKTLLDY